MSVSTESPTVAPERPLAETVLPGAGPAAADRTNAVVGWLAASALLMILGGFGPWAKIASVMSVGGTEGGDGWILITAGALAAGMAVRAHMRQFGRKAAIACGVAGVLGALVAIIDLADIGSYGDGTAAADLVSAGWGLYLALIGALSLAAGGILLAVKARRG